MTATRSAPTSVQQNNQFFLLSKRFDNKNYLRSIIRQGLRARLHEAQSRLGVQPDALLPNLS